MSIQRKRIVGLLLAVLAAVLAASASAELTLDNRKVTDKALLKPIKATEYADWTLYQPEDRESPVDVTKVKEFRKYLYFPVLAVKEDETAILLLKRSGKTWRLDGANRTALTREGWTLRQFTMDHGMTGADGAMFIGFSLTAEDGGSMELFLEPFADSRHFSGISYIPAERAQENLFADYVGIRFNSGLAYTYTNRTTGNNWTYCMDSWLPLAAEYDNFDVFDLSQAPMTIMEGMLPAAVSQDTVMRQFPGEAAPVGSLHAGDEVLAPYGSRRSGAMDWVQVWSGSAMGYVPGDCLASTAP